MIKFKIETHSNSPNSFILMKLIQKKCNILIAGNVYEASYMKFKKLETTIVQVRKLKRGMLGFEANINLMRKNQRIR